MVIDKIQINNHAHNTLNSNDYQLDLINLQGKII